MFVEYLFLTNSLSKTDVIELTEDRLGPFTVFGGNERNDVALSAVSWSITEKKLGTDPCN